MNAGLDGVRDDAERRAARGATGWGKVVYRIKGIAARGRALAEVFRDQLDGPETDPLIPKRAYLKSPSELASIYAVASAVRHLSQREAAFQTTNITRPPWGSGFQSRNARHRDARRTAQKTGVLIRGQGRNAGLMTTQQAIASEARILAEVEAGRGRVDPILPADVAGNGCRRSPRSSTGSGSIAARNRPGGCRCHRGTDRRRSGCRGRGQVHHAETSCRDLREEGRKVLGLAIQNTLVQMLERDTGIPSVTVAKFLYTHRELLEPEPRQEKLEHARNMFENSVLLLDEASMVPNGDQEKLTRLANLLGVARFASIWRPETAGGGRCGQAVRHHAERRHPNRAHASEHPRADAGAARCPGGGAGRPYRTCHASPQTEHRRGQ